MDNRPIGIFDSGLGGLTVVKEFMDVLPKEDIVYFGDTGRVPYGTRSDETIIKYAMQDIAFLKTFDIKAIVVACGTVSTAAASMLDGISIPPVYGIVEPSARKAAALTKNNKIGLLGTNATIKSGKFQAAILKHNKNAEIFPAACPLFVPLVENGRSNPGDIVIETVAASYLKPLRRQNVDTLILGCTHYPILEAVISAYMGKAVTLVNSGAVTADFVKDILLENQLLARRERDGNYDYYVSDTAGNFQELAEIFLGREVRGLVSKADIEAY